MSRSFTPLFARIFLAFVACALSTFHTARAHAQTRLELPVREPAISPDGETHYTDAVRLASKRDFRNARRHCLLALKEQPEDLSSLRLLIRCETELKENDAAVTHYKELLKIDVQLGAGYVPQEVSDPSTPEVTLALARGEVSRLLDDRPQLGRHIVPGDQLHKWLVQRFAGRNLCNLVVWSNELPRTNSPAEHLSPTPFQPAELRVRPTRAGLRLIGLEFERDATHDELWQSVVFEFYNMENYGRFQDVMGLARAGILTRDAYVAEVLLAEFEAEKRALAFYAYEFYPYMRKRGVETDPKVWRLDDITVPVWDRIAQLRNRRARIWQIYEGDYDRLIAAKKSKSTEVMPVE